jgi:hypothetical protein
MLATLFRYVVFTILGFLALLVMFGLWQHYIDRKLMRRMVQLFLQLETTYKKLIEKRLSLLVIEKNSVDIDVDAVSAEMIEMMQPDINMIVHFIEASKAQSNISPSVLKTQPLSVFESSAMKSLSLINKIGAKRQKDVEGVLSSVPDADRQELSTSMKEAIISDVRQRLLGLKSI